VPKFSHVIVMVFENEEITSIIGNSSAPNFNKLANQYALLTNDYAVGHPSLPNYIALTSGNTQGINSDCGSCSVNVTNIADLVESSGRTWKAYLESMPSDCYLNSGSGYTPNHNPFVHYNDIRNDSNRCQQHDVPFTQLDIDLQNRTLPSFAWITPNLCDSGHDCGTAGADKFLGPEVNKIVSSPAFDQNSLLIVTFDEGNSDASCCNLPSRAGGKVATILISGLVKPGYQDATPYSHYSILKTIETSWGLANLGHSNDAQTNSIMDVWK
jgi:phospholipase C